MGMNAENYTGTTGQHLTLAYLARDCNNRLLDGNVVLSRGGVVKISEMEAHHDQYCVLEGNIQAMVQNRQFPAVFLVCVESFPHIVPAIKFRKRRDIEPETPELLAIRTICTYAPALFAHDALESLAQFVKSERVIARHESNFFQDVENALAREEIARKIWNCIERQSVVLESDLYKGAGVELRTAISIIEFWEQLRLIARAKEDGTFNISFICMLDAEAEGLCPACGVRAKGRKELFFRKTVCKNCGTEGYYHIEYPRQ